jgi:hypothetical protein
MPFGFEMGEGMMAMMGKGGFGPGPTVFGRMDLNTLGFASELKPGLENCFNIGADLLGVTLPGGVNGAGTIETEIVELSMWISNSSGGTGTADSFFDVFVEPPPYKFCTSTPSPVFFTSTPSPVFFTSTSTPVNTSKPGQLPTATSTVRTGNTPGPTPTLGRVIGTNTPARGP